jgi:hypothetical protein
MKEESGCKISTCRIARENNLANSEEVIQG